MIRLALLFALIAAPAQAAEMAFYMKNRTSDGVVVELTSRDRDMVWPGGGKVYFLDEDEKKSVPIECQPGETICYGAWVNGDAGTYWGIGPERDQQCDNCCTICAAKATEVISLNP